MANRLTLNRLRDTRPALFWLAFACFTHMSRHTFATETCLSQGVPLETTSRMLGHKSLTTTQIYAKVTQNKVAEEMKALAERINGKYSLVSVNQS